jgi:anaerobic magnesium-protoporphyrin IX monomethyl ester cyclase
VRDRKIRAIGILSLISGTVLVFISLALYWLNLPPKYSLPILVLYTAIQFRLAAPLFDRIYRSRLIDLPQWLLAKYPPMGYEAQHLPCEVLLLRTPSAVMSAPDCGEALGLGYLASVLRKRGTRVTIIDSRLMGLDAMQTVELIQAYTPRALGINLNFQYLGPSTAEIVQALRDRNFSAHITLGGLYASVAYQQIMDIMPGVDTLVRFEGENTYIELIDQLDSSDKWDQIPGLVYRDRDRKVVANSLRSLIPDLNSIPVPSRDWLPTVGQMGGYAYVVSSRGCNGVCAYCVQQRSVTDPLGKRWRGRDVEQVVDEVERIRNEGGIRMISFVDDDLFGDVVFGETHAHRIAKALIKRNLDISILLSVQPRDVEYEVFSLLKQAGVDSVILAVDNFSQPVLDRYRKLTTVEQNLRSIDILLSLGIDAYLGIIMFDPWTTLDELKDNFQILGSVSYLRPWQILSKLEVYRGSPITQELESLGILEWKDHTARYHYLDERIQGVYTAIEEIMKILHPAMNELDGFRWGNLYYSETDDWILNHFKEQLADINIEFNHQALDSALEIVNRQAASTKPEASMVLAESILRKQAESINRNTIWELSQLRKEAIKHKKEFEQPSVKEPVAL